MKTYHFRINVQPAQFDGNAVGVMYGLAKDCRLHSEETVATLPEALARLQEVSNMVPGPHAAFLHMAHHSDRRPPGFKTAATRVYKREA